MGLFSSTDPAEQFFNSYSYTGGNPINFTDPTGMVVENVNRDEELKFMFSANEADLEYYFFNLEESKTAFQWENVFEGWNILQTARANIGIDYSVKKCDQFALMVLGLVKGEEIPFVYNASSFDKYPFMTKIAKEDVIWGEVLQWGGHVAIHDPTSSTSYVGRNGYKVSVPAGMLQVNVGARKPGYSSGYYPNSWWGEPKNILRYNQ